MLDFIQIAAIIGLAIYSYRLTVDVRRQTNLLRISLARVAKVVDTRHESGLFREEAIAERIDNLEWLRNHDDNEKRQKECSAYIDLLKEERLPVAWASGDRAKIDAIYDAIDDTRKEYFEHSNIGPPHGPLEPTPRIYEPAGA